MQKLYYSISEICSMIGEEAHVLRYWEKEFGKLKPKKNRAGNRVYSAKDLELLQRIKHYLRDEKMSLKGAREKLDAFLAGSPEPQIDSKPQKQTDKQKTDIGTNLPMPSHSMNEEIRLLLSDILNFLKYE